MTVRSAAPIRATSVKRAYEPGLVRDLGAERFISAGAGQPGPAAGGFDVVIDTVGGAVLDGSYGLLREGGRLVTLGAPLEAFLNQPPVMPLNPRSSLALAP